MNSLSPKRQARREELMHVFRHRSPAITMPLLPPSERLHYELLSEVNEAEMLAMFADDPSPYVQRDFKHADSLSHYVDHLLTYSRYSAKRAGCDWLLRHRANGHYLGVLHLYDLSQETFFNYHRKCTLGFAIRASARRQGFASEAVRHLLAFLRRELHQMRALAYTHHDNQASQALLRHLGFVGTPADQYIGNYAYYEYWWDPSERAEDQAEAEALRRNLAEDPPIIIRQDRDDQT